MYHEKAMKDGAPPEFTQEWDVLKQKFKEYDAKPDDLPVPEKAKMQKELITMMKSIVKHVVKHTT